MTNLNDEKFRKRFYDYHANGVIPAILAFLFSVTIEVITQNTIAIIVTVVWSTLLAITTTQHYRYLIALENVKNLGDEIIKKQENHLRNDAIFLRDL